MTAVVLRLLCAAAALVTLAGCGAAGPGPAAPADDHEGVLGTEPSDPPAESPPGPYGVRLDVLENHTVLHSVEGQSFPIPAGTSYVLRTPTGWLYGTATGPVTLLTPDGATQPLAAVVDQQSLEMPGAPVVSADGTRIAWAEGDTVHTGQITASGIQDVRSSPVPAGTYPKVWTGERVILGRSYEGGCCGHRPAEYDVWDPAAGDFVPHWTRQLSPVYGPVPVGAPLVGVTEGDPGGDSCLARLDGVRDLSATASTCRPGLNVGSLMWTIAPDGRHLVELVDSVPTMIDLTTLTLMDACPGEQPLLWEDNRTVLIAGPGTPSTDGGTSHVFRCTVDGESEEVPGLVVGANLTLVPRLG